MLSWVVRALSRRGVVSTTSDPRSGRTRSRQGVGARLLATGIVFAASVGFGFVRHIPAPSVLAGEPVPPPPGDPRVALFNAASHLESRLSPAGSGITFTASQVQVLRPDPAGPNLLLQPDRDHPTRVPTPVDQIVLGSLSGRGSATDDSFFAEWFNGTDLNGLPIFQGEPAYTGLVHDGELWRRDERTDDAGLGWVPGPDIPGFGVDPASLRELPGLLRRLRDPKFIGFDSGGRHWTGVSDALWYPGAVAVDGASFTGSPIAIELWLDDSDRIVALFAVARNINESTYMLLCLDRVMFEFPTLAVPIPTDPEGLP